MKLCAPTQMVWYMALAVGVVGVIAGLVTIPVLSGFVFWLVVIAWLILAVSTAMKGV